MADQYTYPDSEVLINKFDVRDTLLLHAYERKYVTARIHELSENPIKGNFDIKHLQEIHGHLFQDMFSWAGELRETDIARMDVVTNQTYEFCQSHLLEGFQHDIFKNLKKQNYLMDLDKDQFSKGAAELMGEINMLHPFREGNGRTQREFMRELAQQAGWELDFTNVSKEQMTEASIRSMKFDYSGLEDMIKTSLRPAQMNLSPEFAKKMDEISQAVEIDKIKTNSLARNVFNSYAKEAMKNGAWSSQFDKEIAYKMMQNKSLSEQKITAALAYSPSMIGLSNIDKTIAVRTMIKDIKIKHPEIKKSRGIER